MSTTMTIRPIDEELTRLHQPVVTTAEDDKIRSALDGFRVTNSGSVMVPSGFTKPLMMQRSLSTISTANSSYSSGSNPAGGYHQNAIHGSLPRYSTSVPSQLPHHSLPGSIPRSLPRSMPKNMPPYPYSYPHHSYNMAGSPMTGRFADDYGWFSCGYWLTHALPLSTPALPPKFVRVLRRWHPPLLLKFLFLLFARFCEIGEALDYPMALFWDLA
eukprot:CAMPEP_0117080234 /NCGR_PEP_ID=MMETSP0472-20121206/56616_1 /TAXON_ID=693140 ORGANISM="Tiarina fusus, Strain LIS" /NCGR_SAMPLE_ID=MMETSP0472 /ASSEMBLY_ACC=CAM_ASM_000603 /LENGTH=214 /DNA_ID=CAMNT_0004807803 /DNA_START=13 /DNA_END=654 /DNA_ORIENTATION=-